MMKLSLIKEVFETVNSDWECELAKSLILNWDHTKNWIKMWRASANFICFFKNLERQYVTRFNRNFERTFQELSAEIDLLNFLDSKNVRIAKPVLSRNNRYIEESDTSYGTFYSIVLERISGEQKEFESLELDEFYEWGKSLGTLHKVIKEKSKSVRIQRKTHSELLEGLLGEVPLRDEVEEIEVRRIKEWLNSLPINEINYGLIHYDFELDNLIWNSDGITIIDFDDCIYSWFIADIAYALRDLFQHDLKINFEDVRVAKFLAGYKIRLFREVCGIEL